MSTHYTLRHKNKNPGSWAWVECEAFSAGSLIAMRAQNVMSKT
jgi:hypothetical protein